MADRAIELPIPGWLETPLPVPGIPPNLATPEGAKAVSDEVYYETLKKHRVLEQCQGMDGKFVMDLVRLMCDRATAEFQKGKWENTKMGHWTGLISHVTDIEQFALDNPIRLACESVVLNLFCRFVKHHSWVSSPAQLLNDFNKFEKERSYWWRKQVAKPTPENTREKFDKLIADTPALLNFYNAVLHASSLLVHPTLKHTVTLSALTAEGRSYENGQGRSIASECRHMLVRKECVIPIKPRPPRSCGSSAASGAGKVKKGAVKAQAVQDSWSAGPTVAAGVAAGFSHSSYAPAGVAAAFSHSSSAPAGVAAGVHYMPRAPTVSAFAGIGADDFGLAHHQAAAKKRKWDTNYAEAMPPTLPGLGNSFLGLGHRSADDVVIGQAPEPFLRLAQHVTGPHPLDEADNPQLHRIPPPLPAVRMSSNDWPLHLGLDDFCLPPSLSDEEEAMFTSTSEQGHLMLQSLSDPRHVLMPVGQASLSAALGMSKSYSALTNSYLQGSSRNGPGPSLANHPHPHSLYPSSHAHPHPQSSLAYELGRQSMNISTSSSDLLRAPPAPYQPGVGVGASAHQYHQYHPYQPPTRSLVPVPQHLRQQALAAQTARAHELPEQPEQPEQPEPDATERGSGGESASN